MQYQDENFKPLNSPFITSRNPFHPICYEPLRENRFMIDLIDGGIHPYLIRDYKLYNEGGEFYFEINFVELINFVYNPKDIFNISSVQIKYLDPIGDVINGLTFQVRDVSFTRNQSYKNDGIQTNNLKFKVVFSSIELLDKNYKKI